MALDVCSWRATRVWLGVGVVALAVVGCATHGFDRTTNIAEKMAKQTSGMQAAKPQVDEMLASLESLVTAQGDMKPAFKKFSDTLDDTEKMAARARKAGESIREQEAEYLAAWQQEAAAITNPELKAATQARQAEVKNTLDALSAAGKKASDAYQPFISDMKDIRTYLSNDLTQAGVKRIEPTIQKARQAGAGLQKALDDFNQVSQRVQTALRPAR
jgi:chromosome segregation ATPase